AGGGDGAGDERAAGGNGVSADAACVAVRGGGEREPTDAGADSGNGRARCAARSERETASGRESVNKRGIPRRRSGGLVAAAGERCDGGVGRQGPFANGENGGGNERREPHDEGE